MARNPTLRFYAFDQHWLILGLREGDTTSLQKIVYLGDGHTMGRNSAGEFYSTRIRRNTAYAADSLNCASFLEGIARLGGFDRKTAAKFKAQKEAHERQQHISWAAAQILKCWPHVAGEIVMSPAMKRRLQRLANKA